eukprot:994430-Amorphochlora_amoeboformis.AAC.1
MAQKGAWLVVLLACGAVVLDYNIRFVGTGKTFSRRGGRVGIRGLYKAGLAGKRSGWHVASSELPVSPLQPARECSLEGEERRVKSKGWKRVEMFFESEYGLRGGESGERAEEGWVDHPFFHATARFMPKGPLES